MIEYNFMHEWGGGARRAVGLLVKNTNKGWGEVVQAMSATDKGGEIVSGMISSETRISIQTSSAAPKQDGKVLYGITTGVYNIATKKYESASITIFVGNFTEENKNNDPNGEFVGVSKEEFLNAVGTHEGTHSLEDPALVASFYDQNPNGTDDELRVFLQQNAETNPDANESISRGQFNEDKTKKEDEK